MGALLGLVILALDVVAIIDALKGSMDTAKKILWIILIVVIPIIGMAAYFLIAKKK